MDVPSILRFVPDKLYLQMLYFKHLHRFIDWENPIGFNEKLQWLKIHNRNPLYTQLVDKLAVRSYIASKIGEEYLIPIVGGPWKDARDIVLSELPNQFVLKCNHDSKSVVICRDRDSFDFDAAQRSLNGHLMRNLYWYGREWPYKYVDPCIIAEMYMENSKCGVSDISDYGISQSVVGCKDLDDYKVMCFHGIPRLIQLHKGRTTGVHTQDFYDADWTLTDIEQIGVPRSRIAVSRPSLLDEMLEKSKVLSSDMPHVRVDWYIVNERLYFGELTLFDGSGLCPFVSFEQDAMIGSWLDLSKV